MLARWNPIVAGAADGVLVGVRGHQQLGAAALPMAAPLPRPRRNGLAPTDVTEEDR